MIRDVPAWWRQAYRKAGSDAANMPPAVPLSRSWVSVGGQWLDPGEARLLASCVRWQVARNLLDAVLWWSVPLLSAIATVAQVGAAHVVLTSLTGTMCVFWIRIVLFATIETVRQSIGWLGYANSLCC